ncbi:hypothetical protein GCM10011363_08080 [Marivita lacus]|uniref:MobA/MobL protein domain-containing protein n=1 Tax=Marivita lacus TaxID=1323742 RepID=A0ABQ1KBK7_9RHOB|nr:MobA/MobL family protein [Marivita lacus]GGB93837.1 hypothetical protein GCM10011363_08080 [Marivita lacus]
MKPKRIHPASHCPLLVISRADGRSSVAAAAYAARTSMTDERTGRRYNYRSAVGLISEGLVGWEKSAEDLWNAAEKAEIKRNARVARELRPALPAELPLAEQHRLVKGFSCWLRDEFHVAVHYVVHAPNFNNAIEGKRLWRDRHSAEGLQELHNALFDPAMTNRNFHAHIRFTTRKVDRDTGAFGEKTRELDDLKTGPEMLLKIRAEWQRRTNQALARNGSHARIDLRSYKAMAEAGDAPEGLESQDHLGPRTTQKARAAGDDVTQRMPMAAIKREQAQARNEERWACWLTLRALERKKARLSGRSEKIAAAREAERKKQRDTDTVRIVHAQTEQDKRQAVDEAGSIDLTTSPSEGYDAAIVWANTAKAPSEDAVGTHDHQGSSPPVKPESDQEQEDEFEQDIDPEEYENPDTVAATGQRIRVRRKEKMRVRLKGAG